MSKAHTKKEPLLYINQPSTIKPPKVNMQEVFSAKKAREFKKQMEIKRALEKKKQVQNGVKAETRTDVRKTKKKKTFYLEDLDEETGIFGTPKSKEDPEIKNEGSLENIETAKEQNQEQGNANSSETGHFFQKVKSFKEMNTEERLEYLDNFPKQLPPVPCLFQTEDKAIRGYLKGKDKNEIEVLLFDKNLKTLPIEELKTVRMIGLN